MVCALTCRESRRITKGDPYNICTFEVNAVDAAEEILKAERAERVKAVK
jgi:hypothetical protein